MMGRPTRVYLDNSDLSNLFKGGPSVQGIRQDLMELKATGSAQFCFSVWHVLEFIQPPPPEYIEEHRSKSKFLYELCGDNALPHFSDILANSQRTIGKDIWLPLAILDKISFDLKAAYREQVKELDGLNRQQRRRLQSSAAFRQVRSAARNLETHVTSELPMNQEFKDGQYLTKFIRGEISQKTFAKHLAMLFSHPPIFYEQWYLKSTSPNLLHDLSRKLEDELFRLIADMQLAIAKIASHEKERMTARKAIKDIEKELKSKGISVPRQIKESRLRIDSAKLDFEKLLLQVETPSRLAYIKPYLAYVSFRDNFKRSDLGDIMHIFHTPDVDLMRVDTRMFEIMKNNQYIQHNKFVRTLAELPERIRLSQLN